MGRGGGRRDAGEGSGEERLDGLEGGQDLFVIWTGELVVTVQVMEGEGRGPV